MLDVLLAAVRATDAAKRQALVTSGSTWPIHEIFADEMRFCSVNTCVAGLIDSLLCLPPSEKRTCAGSNGAESLGWRLGCNGNGHHGAGDRLKSRSPIDPRCGIALSQNRAMSTRRELSSEWLSSEAAKMEPESRAPASQTISRRCQSKGGGVGRDPARCARYDIKLVA